MEKTEEEQKLEHAREAHRKRSKEIAANCNFTEHPLSDRGKEAYKILEMLFEEATVEIATMLPDGYRAALCLEHLEESCMWAKKAIHSHDQYLAKLENERAKLEEMQNGAGSNEN